MSRGRVRLLASICLTLAVLFAVIAIGLVAAAANLMPAGGRKDPQLYSVFVADLGTFQLELITFGRPTDPIGNPNQFAVVLNSQPGIGIARRLSGQMIFLAPYWLPPLFLAVTGVALFYRSRAPCNPYACPTCGYDLRGTNSAGISRCPECGAATSVDTE